MMRISHFAHSFVDTIPEQLAPGTLYISLRYKTVTHLCCCGCGNEVVTPLSPAQWCITFDGENVSLYPSVGNWNLPCRSHYIIKNSKVFEAEQWSEEQVAYGRARDKRARVTFYEGKKSLPQTVPTKESPSTPQVVLNWWACLRRYLLSKN